MTILALAFDHLFVLLPITVPKAIFCQVYWDYTTLQILFTLFPQLSPIPTQSTIFLIIGLEALPHSLVDPNDLRTGPNIPTTHQTF
jgi:hypothetical protein